MNSSSTYWDFPTSSSSSPSPSSWCNFSLFCPLGGFESHMFRLLSEYIVSPLRLLGRSGAGESFLNMEHRNKYRFFTQPNIIVVLQPGGASTNSKSDVFWKTSKLGDPLGQLKIFALCRYNFRNILPGLLFSAKNILFAFFRALWEAVVGVVTDNCAAPLLLPVLEQSQNCFLIITEWILF